VTAPEIRTGLWRSADAAMQNRMGVRQPRLVANFHNGRLSYIAGRL
jgi:hypothetical protein